MLTRDTAICIRCVDYSETSQVVSFFTRSSGKVSVIAKGSKRPKSPFDGPIEILSSGDIVYSLARGDSLATLTEFEQQVVPAGLRGNLFALNCSFFAAELIEHLTAQNDPHPELFDNFLQFLRSVGRIPATSEQRRAIMTLLILFQLSLLSHLGLQPILSYCVNCKTKYDTRHTTYELYFSSSANGLVCKDCESVFADKIKLSPQSAKCLSDLKLIAQADEKTLDELERVLIFHFTAILHYQPRMAKYVLKE